MIDIEKVASIYCNDLKDNTYIVIVKDYDKKKKMAMVEIWMDDRKNKIEKKISLDNAMSFLQKDSDRDSLINNYLNYLKQAEKINNKGI